MMTMGNLIAKPDEFADIGDWLETLRYRTLWFGQIALFVVALLVADSAALFALPVYSVVMALLLLLLLIVVRLLHDRFARLAAWTFVAGCVVLNGLAIVWGAPDQLLWLLILPVGVAILTSGVGAGVGVAAVLSVFLLWAPFDEMAVEPQLRNVAVLGMWGVTGLLWLALNSLLGTVHWAWSHYTQNLALLEEARDRQLELHQALDDLRTMSQQLAHMHRLAQGLRQVADNERRAKEEFVAKVSHELRTPLNMIIGFSEMMTQSPQMYGGEIAQSLLSDLNVVLRNSQHLSALIDDVLDLSQIEAGQMALTKEYVRLPEVIESVQVAVRPLFDSKHLRLDVVVDEQLPPVFCDRTRIREVLLNLLSNAGRFTERGGVKVQAWVEENTVVVSVTDTGPGIAEADRQRIFQPFQQLDNTIRRRFGGTGLGLSISKSFVELHNGKMWVESEPGQGTTFFFSLPVEPPLPLDTGDALRWFNPYQSYDDVDHLTVRVPTRVLPRVVVVERQGSLQKLVSRHVDDVEVVPVGSLAEAVVEITSTPAQAIMVNEADVPGALEEVDILDLPNNVPIFGCSVPGIEQATAALGVFDYLVKPISSEQLLSAIDRVSRNVQTVLVVDDEPDALRLFRRMLVSTGRGYRVIRASNGKQALSMLEHEPVDVILLDLAMPEMDGLQFLAIREQDPALYETPVILISARDPLGQPIVSNAITVTRSGGLSVTELLACFRAFSSILSPLRMGDGARAADRSSFGAGLHD